MCLDCDVAIQRDRVEGLRKAFLHVLVEVDSRRRTGRFEIAAVAAGVAGVGHRVAAGLAVGGAGTRADGLVNLRGRDGIGAVVVVEVTPLGGDVHGEGVGRGVLSRHGGGVMKDRKDGGMWF